MPRLPTDYSKNIIYKLCCLDQTINDIYIGQTTDFTKRKNAHKTSCCNSTNNDYHAYVYQFIREHDGWNNWQMIQIEQYPCNNKREAEARETYWMNELKSTLNSKKSFQTKEERKEQLKENNKEWKKTDEYKEYIKEYEKNDKRKEYKKEYKQSDKYKTYLKNYDKQRYLKKQLYLNELKCFNL